MATPVVEVHRDPALDTDRAHQHPHVHHANGSNCDVTYTIGTTVDPPNIPPQSPRSSPAPYEKDGIPAAFDVEKGSDGSKEAPESAEKPRWTFSAFYRKYKIFFHIFFFAFFTG